MYEIAGALNFKFLYSFIFDTYICHCQLSHNQTSESHCSSSDAFVFKACEGGVLQNWLYNI